jgi:hypothetical protein
MADGIGYFLASYQVLSDRFNTLPQFSYANSRFKLQTQKYNRYMPYRIQDPLTGTISWAQQVQWSLSIYTDIIQSSYIVTLVTQLLKSAGAGSIMWANALGYVMWDRLGYRQGNSTFAEHNGEFMAANQEFALPLDKRWRRRILMSASTAQRVAWAADAAGQVVYTPLQFSWTGFAEDHKDEVLRIHQFDKQTITIYGTLRAQAALVNFDARDAANALNAATGTITSMTLVTNTFMVTEAERAFWTGMKPIEFCVRMEQNPAYAYDKRHLANYTQWVMQAGVVNAGAGNILADGTTEYATASGQRVYYPPVFPYWASYIHRLDWTPGSQNAVTAAVTSQQFSMEWNMKHQYALVFVRDNDQMLALNTVDSNGNVHTGPDYINWAGPYNAFVGAAAGFQNIATLQVRANQSVIADETGETLLDMNGKDFAHGYPSLWCGLISYAKQAYKMNDGYANWSVVKNKVVNMTFNYAYAAGAQLFFIPVAIDAMIAFNGGGSIPT